MTHSASDIREKTKEEIKKLTGNLKEELFRLKIRKATGQLEKTHRLKELRRDLARIYTLNKGDVK